MMYRAYFGRWTEDGNFAVYVTPTTHKFFPLFLCQRFFPASRRIEITNSRELRELIILVLRAGLIAFDVYSTNLWSSVIEISSEHCLNNECMKSCTLHQGGEQDGTTPTSLSLSLCLARKLHWRGDELSYGLLREVEYVVGIRGPRPAKHTYIRHRAGCGRDEKWSGHTKAQGLRSNYA